MPFNASPPLTDSARARRIVMQSVLVVAGAVAVMWLLYELRMILLLLAFTALFCYLIAPLVDFFESSIKIGRFVLRIPHTMAIIIVYFMLGVIVALGLEKVAPLLSDQLSSFFENMPNYAKQLDSYMKQLATLPNRYRLPAGWRPSLNEGMNATITGLLDWLQTIALKTVSMATYLLWLALIPILGFFFLKDAKAISNKFLSTLPAADLRYRVTIFLKDVSETLAAYI